MRTTIRIDDELYRSVKERAARSGRTIGEVIEDALRTAFNVRAPSGDLEPTPVFGGSGTLPGVDLSDGPALREVMDDGEVDALR